MNTPSNLSPVPSPHSLFSGRLAALPVLCFAALLLLLQGCEAPNSESPRSFTTPNDAVASLTKAVRADNSTELLAIMGPQATKIISSGDQAADRQRRQKFLQLYDQKHELIKDNPDKVTLTVGDTDWPFPVPIVRQNGSWQFDVDAGLDEIINRRIGENELSAIQVCEAIGDAQREYALRNRNANGVNVYAQKFMSDPGTHNGLYWPTSEGEQPSPLGEFAAQAASEGYKRNTEGPTPYHGYYYRILLAQGPHAPDGALSYVVNGEMTLGFAVVAYPAEYGNSGIMTFIMGPDGVVYQKDLGEDTQSIAKAMKEYDPGDGWTKPE